ncbi:MAG TPA: TIGR03086 family metal-binding protein [Acidimicrobiales bacterium]
MEQTTTTADFRTIADRFRRLAADFEAKVAAVAPDRWEAPSPCEGWTARDVVRHVVDIQGIFLGLVGRQLGDIPSVDDDPLAAWRAARDAMQANLDDPERASAQFDGHFGRTTLAQAVDRFICFDLVLHGWDLARAAGLDDRIDPEEVRRVMQDALGFGDAARSPRVFGPALDPPPGADEQTKLLAFTGRRAWD